MIPQIVKGDDSDHVFGRMVLGLRAIRWEALISVMVLPIGEIFL